MRFDSFHPAVHVIFFLSVLFGTIFFSHPVFIGISLCAGIFCSVQLEGKKAALFDGLAVLLAAAFAAAYGGSRHFGVTVLCRNFIGNAITVEALLYGLALGFTGAAGLIWLFCIHKIMTADKIVFLLGRIAPRISLFAAVGLRLLPRVRRKAAEIRIARKGIAKRRGVGRPFQTASILLTWGIDSIGAVSDSMKARGCTLKGRTAFAVYRFDNRDRVFVVAMFVCITGIFMAYLLEQTKMYYNPEIIWNKPTGISYIFYGIYALYCLLPCLVQIWYEWRIRDNGQCRER